LKIETQAQDNCTLTMTVEVEDERVQPALRSAAKRLAKQYRFPGFRPGKAPYETVLRQVGEATLYGEALEELGQKVYEEALEQQSVEAFAPGALEDVQFKPMVLTFTVPLPPEIDLGDYRSELRVPYTPPEVSDEQVQETMEGMREQQAVLEPVDTPAEIGSMVTLDAKAFLNEGENPSDFLLADEDVALVLEEGADWPMPGFASQVVGLSAGEEKKFDLTFSEEYANQSLRGQVAHFEVTLKEVKRRTLPEWSDELAKELGEFESLEDLRTKTRAGLLAEAEHSTKREYADAVISELVERASVKFPPVLLEHEIDHAIEDLDQRLRQQNMTLDDYLKMQSKTPEAFREEIKPQTEARLRRSLVLGEVVRREKLEIGPEQLERHIDELSQMYGERAGAMREILARDRSREMLSLDLLTDLAVDRLTAIARGDEVPPIPADDDGADGDEAAAEPSEPAEPEASLEAAPAADEPEAGEAASEETAASDAARASQGEAEPGAESAEARTSG
jgi:trigger factor